MIEYQFKTLHDKGLDPETMTPIEKGNLEAVKGFGEDLLEEVHRLNKVIKVRNRG